MFTFMGTVLFSCNQILSVDFSSLNLSDLWYINGLRDMFSVLHELGESLVFDSLYATKFHGANTV